MTARRIPLHSPFNWEIVAAPLTDYLWRAGTFNCNQVLNRESQPALYKHG